MTDKIILHQGNCLDVLRQLAHDGVQVDAVITDPPYHLTSIVKRFGKPGSAVAKSGKTGAYARASKGFMGKEWDGGDIAFQAETWALVQDVMKPGAHLAAFSATRTYHRMACAIEDAGLEVRDMIGWLYGSGFPKSHDVSKAIDKMLTGVVRGAAGKPIKDDEKRSFGQHYARNEKGDPITTAAAATGFGTALKPAQEPICLARKPLAEKSIAAQFMATGTGAMNIDAARVEVGDQEPESYMRGERSIKMKRAQSDSNSVSLPPIEISCGQGRWPANIVHDGSDEVLAVFPETLAGSSGIRDPHVSMGYGGGAAGLPGVVSGYDDQGGSAARFFYTAKADADERFGSNHPTVKPLDLMRWLVRLLVPKGGLVLDLFAGTGTTGIAAFAEGSRAILIEREDEYCADIRRRIDFVTGAGADSLSQKMKNKKERGEIPLFAGVA